MKTSNIRSMRDVPTIQGLKNRSVPDTTEQVMSELARLEHEKARLERENTIWLSNQKKAQTRINQAQERIDILRRLLDELSPRPGIGITPAAEEVVKKDRKYREVKLEY